MVISDRLGYLLGNTVDQFECCRLFFDMRLLSEQLYTAMIRELTLCREKSPPLLIWVELSFRIAEDYKQLLEEQLKQYVFTDQHEEICFYKNQLPLFLAESAFYCLLNYAHNFCPAGEEEQEAFWLKQSLRLDRFRQKHAAFYSYYMNEQCQLDGIYYIPPFPDNYPKLIGDLLARKRYKDYAEDRLKLLRAGE